MIPMTPRQKLDAEVAAIAAKYGLTTHEALRVGRTAKRMIVRREIYRFVLDRFNGRWVDAARYLGKDTRTLQIVLRGRKPKCADQ